MWILFFMISLNPATFDISEKIRYPTYTQTSNSVRTFHIFSADALNQGIGVHRCLPRTTTSRTFYAVLFFRLISILRMGIDLMC